MSGADTFRQLYDEAVGSLDKQHLGTALESLRRAIGKTDSYELNAECGELESAYGLLLGYMRQEVSDPGRGQQRMNFIARAYELAEKAAMAYRIKEVGWREARPLQQILRDLEDWGMASITSPEKNADLHTRHALYIELFGWARYSPMWTPDMARQAEELMCSAFVPDSDKTGMVCGLMLGCLFSFDPRKAMFLAKQYCVASDTGLRVALLVAFVLPLQRFKARLFAYPALADAARLMADNAAFADDMMALQLLLLESRATHKVNKKMREEIMPELIRNRGFDPEKFGIGKVEDFDGLNPEWKKLDSTIGKLAELEMKGADVYYATFSQLKNFPFFDDEANWFFPYDADHPSVPQHVKDAGSKGLMNILLGSGSLCDSDKYSLCLLTTRLPEAQLKLLASQLPVDTDDVSGEAVTREAACRNALRNLFRYFYLYKGGKPDNPFEGDVNIADNALLAPAFNSCEAVTRVGTFAIDKEDYGMAVKCLEKGATYDKSRPDIYQKLGYCYQRKHLFPEAVDAYGKAFAVDGNSKWTISHLAQACLQAGNYGEALGYYRLLDGSGDDDGRVALRCGECLVRLERYGEAIKEYFKAEYLSPDNRGAKRAIAWCSVLAGDMEQARKYYSRLAEMADATADDMISAGHTAWIGGAFEEAVDYYSKAAKKLNSAEFMKRYLADTAILSANGICDDDILLMADLATVAH